MTTFFERKLRQEFVTFLEPQATEDETRIAELLRNFFIGLNRHDLSSALSVFSNDASIHPVLTDDPLSLREYETALKKVFPRLQFTALDDAIIRTEKEPASVVGRVTVVFTDRAPYQGNLALDCARVNGSWRIVRTRHFPL